MKLLTHGRTRVALCRGFSLLEVILAIGIAVGLMLVVLHFYRQAAELRTQAVAETGKLRETRLVMQKFTDELQRIFDHPTTVSFKGDSNSVQFVTTHLPDRSEWQGSELGRASRPETDLILVRYVGGPTRSNGFFRSAQSLVTIRDPNVDEAADDFDDEEMSEEAGEERDAAETENDEESETDSETGEDSGAEADADDESGGRAEQGEDSKSAFDTLSQPRLLTQNIRFSRFRFWNGEEWQDTWSGQTPPEALEITLGFEPLPELLEPDQYPHEIFRRAIYIGPVEQTAAGVGDDGFETDENDETREEGVG